MNINGILLCIELLIAVNIIVIAIHGTRIWSTLLDIKNELQRLQNDEHQS